jgi:hypothetical protein
MFNIKDIRKKPRQHARYLRQIERVTRDKGYTENIEKAVGGSIRNIQAGARSFVIYGEPQSGKTEMMIALTARLLDEGHKIIIVLLNDSVQLLGQNLPRFQRSGIDPAPKNFSEILDPVVTIGDGEWVIFSKKNPKDLQKLIQKIGHIENKVVIDDEADYASPNAKVNKGEKTKINGLIDQLLGDNGIYLGITATPARLDLNNTFRNENEKWVDFPPHPLYKGQETFFPTSLDEGLQFQLELLPDVDDAPKYLREALFSFLVSVAYLNLKVNDAEKNYSILIHTSGKRADHSTDYTEVVKTFNILKKDDEKSEKYYRRIWEVAQHKYPGEEDDLTRYIYENRSRNTIVVMNSDSDKNVVDFTNATNPSTLFTIAIGGNIVSRGVTFDNLLSMFFTRDVKHKIQQDTYIQRARMFGSRGHYLPFFELHIPEKLYADWHKCFVFHRLSLDSIRSGNGSPVWLEDTRVAATASGSIDKTTVAFDSGEMGFELFDYNEHIESIVSDSSKSSFAKLEALSTQLGKEKLPDFMLEWLRHFSPDGDKSILVHRSSEITEKYTSADVENLKRAKGFMSTTVLNKEKEKKNQPEVIHHFKIFYNSKGRARLFYKYDGSIKFLKNLRRRRHD